MLFNSLAFLIFFPIVIMLYFALPQKYRWVLLLLASYYFYMSWKAEYLLLIVASTLIDFYAAQAMSRQTTKKAKKKFLVLSLVSNLGILFGFKYFNFFGDNIQHALDFFNLQAQFPALSVLLPVGISFYTFQTLSYTIDVYNDKCKPENHLGYFAVYVSYFPQLVAGPIERPSNLLPQFKQKFTIDYDRITSGLRLMLWGFFKKLVIADRLAEFVNKVYGMPDQYGSWFAIVATLFFALQIYCDFSGYSDIAIGAARIMGHDLMTNFRRPYFAASIGEFWHRWHISLSTWFRDYVYIPLGGNRVSPLRRYANLMITFVVSGFWHGANWTFIVWGFIHGGVIVIENMFKPFFKGRLDHVAIKALRWVVVLFIVCVAWVFFRAESVGDAFMLLKHAAGFYRDNPKELVPFLPKVTLIAVILLFAVEIVQERFKNAETQFLKIPRVVRWAGYGFLILFIALYGSFHSETEFIYFQF